MKNRYLVDTHTLIWSFENNKKLPQTTKNIIDDTNNDIFVSIASLWEMAIKISIGKLDLSVSLTQLTKDVALKNIQILPVNSSHVLKVENLPFHHKDPFDRIIIAQSLTENITLISVDGVFDSYGIKRLF